MPISTRSAAAMALHGLGHPLHGAGNSLPRYGGRRGMTTTVFVARTPSRVQPESSRGGDGRKSVTAPFEFRSTISTRSPSWFHQCVALTGRSSRRRFRSRSVGWWRSPACRIRRSDGRPRCVIDSGVPCGAGRQAQGTASSARRSTKRPKNRFPLPPDNNMICIFVVVKSPQRNAFFFHTGSLFSGRISFRGSPAEAVHISRR